MRLLFPVLAAGLALSGGANALTTTFTYTVAPTVLPFDDMFTLSSFNTALGTLTGVEVVLNDTSNASVQIYNVTDADQTFTDASASIPLTLTGPGSASIVDTVTAGPISGTAGPGMSTFSTSNSNNTESVSVQPTGLSSYETPGGVGFELVGTNPTFTGTGPSGLFFGGSAVAGGSVEVEYTYTAAAAPEPAAWALMMVGVGAMGSVLRRRRVGPLTSA